MKLHKVLAVMFVISLVFCQSTTLLAVEQAGTAIKKPAATTMQHVASTVKKTAATGAKVATSLERETIGKAETALRATGNAGHSQLADELKKITGGTPTTSPKADTFKNAASALRSTGTPENAKLADALEKLAGQK